MTTMAGPLAADVRASILFPVTGQMKGFFGDRAEATTQLIIIVIDVIHKTNSAGEAVADTQTAIVIRVKRAIHITWNDTEIAR